MDHLKQNATKYSGLPLPALLYLVQTSAPVNELSKREVWKELFTRYYTEGRTFNLYDALNKKPQMFANTIGWELQYEDVSIPSQHSAAFMRNLIEFIEYVDQQVLKSGVQFEWQLHELKGLQSMIERVRDAKIDDMNLRQKINLFIDKMNATRKESLLALEQAKEEKSTDSSHELVTVEPQELAVMEEKKELMKQELKHLSITVSKMNKKQWEEAINEISLYYKEDQEKLIKHGLRKYDFYSHSHLALLAFKVNLTLKIPNVNMYYLLEYATPYYKQAKELFGSEENLYEIVKDLYFSAQGATEEGWLAFSHSFLERRSDSFSKGVLENRVLQQLKEHYPAIQACKGKHLSDVLNTKIAKKEIRSTTLTFDKNTSQWMTNEKIEKEGEMSLFEQIYQLIQYIQGYGYRNNVSLVRYEIETMSDAKLEFSKKLTAEQRALVQEFCLFPSTLTIDPSTVVALKQPFNRSLNSNFSGDSNYLLYFLKHKFNSGKIQDQELTFLFKTKEGLSFFKETTNHIHSMQGWLKNSEDFIGKVYFQVLRLFDFQKEEDRKHFFQLPLPVSSFFQGHGNLKKEHLEMTLQKLKSEAPHEYGLIAEYFSDINESYEDYKVHETFEYLSDFERLLLEREGIETGKTIKHQGYKEHNVYYSPEEAQQKFVFEYFQKLYMV